MRLFLSIDVDSPNCDKAKDVIVDVLFKSHAISVTIPEISASCLYSLPLLISQNNLNYVFVAIFSSFLQFVFHCISYFFAAWVQVRWWGLLLGGELLFEYSLDDFSSL